MLSQSLVLNMIKKQAIGLCFINVKAEIVWKIERLELVKTQVYQAT